PGGRDPHSVVLAAEPVRAHPQRFPGRSHHKPVLAWGRAFYPEQVALLAAVYFGAAKLGLTMAFVAEQVTPVLPPTGRAGRPGRGATGAGRPPRLDRPRLRAVAGRGRPAGEGRRAGAGRLEGRAAPQRRHGARQGGARPEGERPSPCVQGSAGGAAAPGSGSPGALSARRSVPWVRPGWAPVVQRLAERQPRPDDYPFRHAMTRSNPTVLK